MSKAVGKVLAVAAIVVGVVAAIPTAGASLGLSAAALSAISAGIAIASFANAALMKQGGDNQARQAAVTTLQIGEVARQAVFGLGAVAGSLVDAFNYGGKYGTDWEVMVVAIADHLCDSLVGFYVNDAYVAFGGDGAVAGYNGQLQVFWRPGSADQVPPATLTSYGGWAGTDRLRGVAYVVFAYKADASDAKSPVWTGGRPSFLSVVRGLKLYDPRRDSTVPGGFGAHRWSDPSTREWSDNAELCRYNYDRGIYACDRVDQPSQLLIGRGLSAIEAPPERIFAAANLCDEDVPLKTGGSEKRYRVGGVIAASDKFGDVAEDFAAAMGGIVIQPEGSVAVEPGHAKAPVAYITDDDLVAGTKVTFSEMRTEADEEWCNTVIPRYVEPTQKWTDHGAPIRRNSADVLADGGPREAPLNLKLVTSGTQAQRIGEIRRRMGRLQRSAGITLGPRFAELESGDWIVWTSARRTKGLPVQFRIESDALSREWRNSLSLREINASVFAWSTNDQIADGATAEAQGPPDGFGVPDPGSWSLVGGALTGADGAQIPAIVFQGAVEDTYVSEVRFEYRPYDATAGINEGWIGTELAAPQVTERRVVLAGGVQYQGAVSYRFPGGQPGERLILGPVVAGDLSLGQGDYLKLVVDKVTSAGRTLTKTAGINGNFDASAYSTVPLRGGCKLTFTAGQTTGQFMLGLNTDPETDPSWEGLDYAWHIKPGGQAEVYRSSGGFSSPTTYDASTVFQIVYDDGAIRFIKDGAVFLSQPAAPGIAFYVDSSFATLGASAANLDYQPVAGTARGAYVVTRYSTPYPVTSTANAIAIQAFEGAVDGGIGTFSFPGGTLNGLSPSTTYLVFWDFAATGYAAFAAPALPQMASSAYIFVREYTTQNADGTYPSEPTAPGGDGGGGYGGGRCPVPEARVLLANDEKTGPGETTTMGELRPGMSVWSAHERTGEWGAWEVERVWRFTSPLFAVDGRPTASPSHLWAINPGSPIDGWERMDAIGVRAGEGEVIAVTVRDAHTYVLIGDDGAWLLSHNKTAQERA